MDLPKHVKLELDLIRNRFDGEPLDLMRRLVYEPQSLSDEDTVRANLYFSEAFSGRVAVAPLLPLCALTVPVSYTPGVAKPCVEIAHDLEQAVRFTNKGNAIAVLSNGSRPLGLGDLLAETCSPDPARPIMEGKCALFGLGGVYAWPIMTPAESVDDYIRLYELGIASSFSGVNLEDIRKPLCFEVEEALLGAFPGQTIMHDDQWGTAVVAVAMAYNAIELLGMDPEEASIVVDGSGAAGYATARLLIEAGFGEVISTDRKGIITSDYNGNEIQKKWLSKNSNPKQKHGTRYDAAGANIYINTTTIGEIDLEILVGGMADRCVLVDMRNPKPAFEYEQVLGPHTPEKVKAKVKAYGSGKGYFLPSGEHVNMINNSLGFPHIFRGALSKGAAITPVEGGVRNFDVLIAAAKALAQYQRDQGLDEHHLLPEPLDLDAGLAVATAVYNTGISVRPPLEELGSMQARYPIIKARLAEQEAVLDYFLRA